MVVAGGARLLGAVLDDLLQLGQFLLVGLPLALVVLLLLAQCTQAGPGAIQRGGALRLGQAVLLGLEVGELLLQCFPGGGQVLQVLLQLGHPAPPGQGGGR